MAIGIEDHPTDSESLAMWSDEWDVGTVDPTDRRYYEAIENAILERSLALDYSYRSHVSLAKMAMRDSRWFSDVLGWLHDHVEKFVRTDFDYSSLPNQVKVKVRKTPAWSYANNNAPIPDPEEKVVTVPLVSLYVENWPVTWTWRDILQEPGCMIEEHPGRGDLVKTDTARKFLVAVKNILSRLTAVKPVAVGGIMDNASVCLSYDGTGSSGPDGYRLSSALAAKDAVDGVEHEINAGFKNMDWDWSPTIVENTNEEKPYLFDPDPQYRPFTGDKGLGERATTEVADKLISCQSTAEAYKKTNYYYTTHMEKQQVEVPDDPDDPDGPTHFEERDVEVTVRNPEDTTYYQARISQTAVKVMNWPYHPVPGDDGPVMPYVKMMVLASVANPKSVPGYAMESATTALGLYHDADIGGGVYETYRSRQVYTFFGGSLELKPGFNELTVQLLASDLDRQQESDTPVVDLGSTDYRSVPVQFPPPLDLTDKEESEDDEGGEGGEGGEEETSDIEITNHVGYHALVRYYYDYSTAFKYT